MKHFFVGSLLASTYLLILLKTLPDYGMSHESPEKFLRGQMYLQVLLTGKDAFDQPSDLPSPVYFNPGQRISISKLSTYESHNALLTPIIQPMNGKTRQRVYAEYIQKHGRQSIYKHNAFNLSYWYIQDKGHPPVSDILMALSNRIFYEKLGVLGDIESYHLYPMFLASLTIFMIYTFTASLWGFLPGIIAAMTLAAYPFFFAESHYNIKDIPELAFYASTLIAFYYWITRSKWRWYLIFVCSFFLAFGTKWNILFIPFILIPWCLSIRKTDVFRHWWTMRAKLALLLVVFVSLVLLVLVWPYLWVSPLLRLIDIFKFYGDEAGLRIKNDYSFYTYLLPFTYFATHIDLRAILLVIGMTPIPVLLLLILGLLSAYGYRHLHHGAGLFILSWLLVPIGKHVIFRIAIISSIRQYMEFLPALAIIAGIGGTRLINRISKGVLISKVFVSICFIILYTLSLSYIVRSHHPNENVYFNRIFAGLSGAQQYFHLDWPISYDNPFKQAVDWLNNTAQPNATLAFVDGTNIAISPLWLRPDIHVGSSFSDMKQSGEYIITLVRPFPPQEFLYPYLDRFLQPLHQIRVDGVALLSIWRNSKEYQKNGMDNVEELTMFKQEYRQMTLGPYWTIDFQSPRKLLSVTITIPQNNCEKGNLKRHGNTDVELSGRMFTPYVVERDAATYDILFPAEETSYVRMFDLNFFEDTTLSSCFYQGTVTGIKVLKER